MNREEAIDSLARAIACSVLRNYDDGYAWELFPEVGEDDWRDVVDRVRSFETKIEPGNELEALKTLASYADNESMLDF